MSESTGTAVAEELSRLKARVDRRNHLAADSAELRERIDEMEREHNGIAFWLEEAERELQRLRGGGLTGLIFAALGQRDSKIESKQREMEGLREDHAAFGKLLEAARGDMAKLDAELAQLADAQREYDLLRDRRRDEITHADGEQSDQIRDMTRQRDEAAARVKALTEAVDAGREAIEHLHDEVHVIASMGRCRVAEGHGLLRGMMQAGRKHAVADCAGRAGKTTARFRRRAESAGMTPETLAGLSDAERLIAGLSGDVKTGKYEVRTVNHETVARIDGIIREALDAIDHALKTEGDRILALDEKIEALLVQP